MMGRRAHKPDGFHRRQVEATAGYGVPEIAIARVVGIDSKTLREHYRHEFGHGHVKANARVVENLFRNVARAEAVPAISRAASLGVTVRPRAAVYPAW